jgi:hypothetical protein
MQHSVGGVIRVRHGGCGVHTCRDRRGRVQEELNNQCDGSWGAPGDGQLVIARLRAFHKPHHPCHAQRKPADADDTRLVQRLTSTNSPAKRWGCIRLCTN